jgi:hypothetical protein
MMRGGRVLNFKGRTISGSIVARFILSAFRPMSYEVKKDNRDQSSLTRDISFLTSLGIGSLGLDLYTVYTARTRTLLEGKQDSNLKEFDITHSYTYFTPVCA